MLFSRRARIFCGSAALALISVRPRRATRKPSDRVNDAIRITGARGPCESDRQGLANLGVTQRGRHPKRAKAGVRLNTDAIDNSAGVNTSDVEVNVKNRAGRTPYARTPALSMEVRNALLPEMTDAVAALVASGTTTARPWHCPSRRAVRGERCPLCTELHAHVGGGEKARSLCRISPLATKFSTSGRSVGTD